MVASLIRALTQVPTYNPIDIVANIKHLIAGEEPTAMMPWFRGFTGEVLEKSKDKFVVRNCIIIRCEFLQLRYTQLLTLVGQGKLRDCQRYDFAHL